jgi:uncharacterized protein (TIGR02271 family)
MENRQHHTSGDAHHHDLKQLFGCEVLDNERKSVGTIDNIWVDDSGQPAFFGVQTGWLFGKLHVVPAHQAHVNYERRRVRLPHSKDKVKDAPSFDATVDLSPAQENEVYHYYGLTSHQSAAPTGREGKGRRKEKSAASTEEEKTIQLNEERAEVRKREVDAGGVRLRKVIRTETVNRPVEVKREDVEIERVPAEEGRSADASSNFEEEEIYIPLRQEEAVMHKETHRSEDVRVGKKSRKEHQDLSETVRKEDIEVERDDDRRYGT